MVQYTIEAEKQQAARSSGGRGMPDTEKQRHASVRKKAKTLEQGPSKRSVA